MYNPPEIWCLIFGRGSRRYLYFLCQSFRGPLAFFVDVTSRRQFACVATPGWMVPLGFANIDEVRSASSFSPPTAGYLSPTIASLISFGSGNALRNIGHHLITASGHSTTRSNMRHRFPSFISQQLNELSYPSLWPNEADRFEASHGMANTNSSACGASAPC